MADIIAPPAAWQRLGVLLEARRKALGFQYRTQLERERKLNKRMQADIEKAYPSRVNTWPESTLMHIADLYEVTWQSMLAVLHGDADALEPAAPVAVLPRGDGWQPPVTDPAAEAAIRPYFDPLNERRVELAAQGVKDPDGAQMFGPGTDDAKTWDGVGARLEVRDRVWLIAELRRNAGRRNGPGSSRTG